MKLCNPKTGILEKEDKKKPKFGDKEKISLKKAYAANSIRASFIPTKTPKQIT